MATEEKSELEENSPPAPVSLSVKQQNQRFRAAHASFRLRMLHEQNQNTPGRTNTEPVSFF